MAARLSLRVGPQAEVSPKSARPLALGLLALLLIACGGGTPAPGPTATPSAIPIPPAATPTLASSRTFLAPTERAVSEPEPRCPDPYPAGAPYEPEPGEPIRLRPTGSPPALARYRPLPFVTDSALEQVVRRSLDDDEHFTVVVKNLADGWGVALAADRAFYAASLFKTWVMLEAYHQREAGLLDFDERYIVSDYYAGEFSLNPGELAACDEVAVGEALQAMIGASDNVAANLLLDRVGAGNVNAALRGLGLVVSGMPADGSLPATAADMALLLEAIARRQAVSEADSNGMLGLLASASIADRLPALLPEGTQVAHKTGNWENATHDAGIVFSPRATYVIVVLSDFGFQEDGASPIARLSRAVYDYYNGN